MDSPHDEPGRRAPGDELLGDAAGFGTAPPWGDDDDDEAGVPVGDAGGMPPWGDEDPDGDEDDGDAWGARWVGDDGGDEGETDDEEADALDDDGGDGARDDEGDDDGRA